MSAEDSATSSETARAVVVATLASPPPADAGERRALLARVREAAEVLEVRADLVGDLDPGELRRDFSGRLLYTLRSRAEGGAFDGSPERRHQRIAAAASAGEGNAAGYDYLDLEADRDLVPAVLDRVAPERRVVSWHGPPAELPELERRFATLSAVPARLYKMVVFATQPAETVVPLVLAATLRRRDLVAFAAGRVGTWTRLVAPRLGAAVVYGAAGADAAGAPGQLTVEELARDYGLPALPTVERLYGVVGNPTVGTSLSPRLHNGAYRALGVPALYVPFEAEAFSDFWLDLVESDHFARLGLPLGGLSVTSPFKRSATAVAGALSPLVESIDSANTLVVHDGVWEAESTDAAGVVGSLAEAGFAVAGRRAVVVGAGGAGRAAAFGLAQAGARVAIANRGPERGVRAAEALGLPYVPLADLDPADHELLVHATPLGRSVDDGPPFDVGRLPAGAAVVDMVYGGEPTPLIEAARRRGLLAVDGRAVLLHQALDQFRLMTGRELPAALGRELLGLAAAAPVGETAR